MVTISEKFIALMVVTLFGSAATNTITEVNWRDPEVPRSLDILGIPTRPLAVGERLQLNCSAQGIAEYTTLTWMRADGAFVFNQWSRGRSILSLSLTVTQELNGAEFYCFAPFMEETPRYFSYFVYSPRIRLSVVGAPPPSFGTNQGFIEMTSDAPSTTHKVGDIVTYTCTTYNLRTAFVTVLLAKGQYETQISVGNQPVRMRRLKIREEDHGVHIYCSVSTLLPGSTATIQIVSNRVPIYVEGK